MLLGAVLALEIAAMASWSFGLVFGQGPATPFGEPRLRQAHMDSVHNFFLRFALLAAIFLLALLMAYLTS